MKNEINPSALAIAKAITAIFRKPIRLDECEEEIAAAVATYAAEREKAVLTNLMSALQKIAPGETESLLLRVSMRMDDADKALEEFLTFLRGYTPEIDETLCEDGAAHIFKQVVTGQTTSGVIGLPVREVICTKCRVPKREIAALRSQANKE